MEVNAKDLWIHRCKFQYFLGFMCGINGWKQIVTVNNNWEMIILFL